MNTTTTKTTSKAQKLKKMVDEKEEQIAGQRDIPDPAKGELMVDEDFDLAAELEDIRQATVAGGMMEVPITDFHSTKNGGGIAIEFRLPNGDVETDTFTKPETWDPENDFVQFLDWYGYSPRELPAIRGEKIYVRAGKPYDNVAWEIVSPPSGAGTRAKSAAKTTVMFPYTVWKNSVEDWDGDNYWGLKAGIFAMAFMSGIGTQVTSDPPIANLFLWPMLTGMMAIGAFMLFSILHDIIKGW